MDQNVAAVYRWVCRVFFKRTEGRVEETVMPQCKKCGKKGMLLRLAQKTRLCRSCDAAFSENSKHLTEKIMENVNLIVRSDNLELIVSRCDQIEEDTHKLVSLYREYSLAPSSQLLDLVHQYREIKQKALQELRK